MSGLGTPGRAPRDISLEDFAAISAAIAESDRPTSELVAMHQLTMEEWQKTSTRWSQRIAADDASAEAYTTAFARAQDRLKPLPSLTPEEWAILVAEFAAEGQAALARRRLGAADYLRLGRHWAKALGVDAALAARYSQSFYAAQRKLTSG